MVFLNHNLAANKNDQPGRKIYGFFWNPVKLHFIFLLKEQKMKCN